MAAHKRGRAPCDPGEIARARRLDLRSEVEIDARAHDVALDMPPFMQFVDVLIAAFAER